ncbi:hypothetical protein HRbin34_00357 [bacterium HR34]|nr:hypothetical protein HRbin34_00357 [bacterium HR34]
MRKDDGKSKVIARDIPVSQKEYKWVALDDIPTLDDIPRIDDFEPPGAACFAKGSKVLMRDGSYKNIEYIKEGDYIAVPNYEEPRKLESSKVVKVINRDDPIITINNKLKASPDQLIYTDKWWLKQSRDIKIGDKLMLQGWEEEEVFSVKPEQGIFETYDFVLENNKDFFVEGYLVPSLPNENVSIFPIEGKLELSYDYAKGPTDYIESGAESKYKIKIEISNKHKIFAESKGWFSILIDAMIDDDIIVVPVKIENIYVYYVHTGYDYAEELVFIILRKIQGKCIRAVIESKIYYSNKSYDPRLELKVEKLSDNGPYVFSISHDTGCDGTCTGCTIFTDLFVLKDHKLVYETSLVYQEWGLEIGKDYLQPRIDIKKEFIQEEVDILKEIFSAVYVANNNLAYITKQESSGNIEVQVLDTSNPQNITLLNSYPVSNIYVVDIFVDGDYIYLAAGFDGLVVLKFSGENSVEEIKRIDTGGYVNDIEIVDDYIYLSDYYNGVIILGKDLSNIKKTKKLNESANIDIFSVDNYKVDVDIAKVIPHGYFDEWTKQMFISSIVGGHKLGDKFYYIDTLHNEFKILDMKSKKVIGSY